MRRLRLLIACLAAIFAAGEAAAQQDPAEALAAAMAERLQLMEGVAQYKWNHEIPIEDLAREALVLDNVVAAAKTEGVPVELASDFFQAQITAAKTIQNRLFETWRQSGAGNFPEAPDLQTEVRPAISALTGRIIASLARLDDMDAAALCPALKEVPAALADDTEAWRLAVTPLRERLPGC